MKCVVITGSTKGFGYELAKKFKSLGYNVVISGTNTNRLKEASIELNAIKSKSKAITVRCDVSDSQEVDNLWNRAIKEFDEVTIWINNAGINQANKPIYLLSNEEIELLLDIDLKGAIFGSKTAFNGMKKQGYGKIFNVEGFGSNDIYRMGISIYGTSKRGLTYFTKALAKESKELTKSKIIVGRISPGVMITEFIRNANHGVTSIKLEEKAKKFYNIAGDFPEDVANFVTKKIIKCSKNDSHIVWLTKRKILFRLLRSPFYKRDFFIN